MKKLTILGILASLFVLVSAGTSQAYWHDDHGWYDAHHHRHPFIYYHHHRGYWDQRNGVRIWVNV